MVEEEKWPINTGVLKNFEEYLKVYNLKLKNELVLSKEEMELLKPNGTYVFKQSEICAVMKVEDVYYIRVKGQIIDIPIGKYFMKVVDLSDKTRRFILSDSSNILVELDYERQKYTNFDPWSEEDDLDFFAWLSKMYNNGRLCNLF